MDIVGGLYRELCETPRWDAVFGSGGRAAAALAGVSPLVRLHTYVSPGPATTAAEALRGAGVLVEAHPRASDVVFSYLHPLSNPHIEPPVALIPRSKPLRVSGAAVLRFGLLEGDAVVDAERAVFDPQTARSFGSFKANGSRAGRLALVLNEGELRALAEGADLPSAARHAMAIETAEVLVLKRGVRGALLFDGTSDPIVIPAYRSETVFKIGTGDVFSAWFAHLWAEREIPAAEAAQKASRAVAGYAGSRILPPPLTKLPALDLEDRPVRICLLGYPTTLGRRFVLEEARHILREMGLAVDSPGLEETYAITQAVNATLAVAEAMDLEDMERLAAYPGDMRLIVLDETGRTGPSDVGRFTACADFTTAVYQTAWAAMETDA